MLEIPTITVSSSHNMRKNPEALESVQSQGQSRARALWGPRHCWGLNPKAFETSHAGFGGLGLSGLGISDYFVFVFYLFIVIIIIIVIVIFYFFFFGGGLGLIMNPKGGSRRNPYASLSKPLCGWRPLSSRRGPWQNLLRWPRRGTRCARSKRSTTSQKRDSSPLQMHNVP